MLIVPHDPLGEEVAMARFHAQSGRRANIEVEQVPNMSSGGGMGYMGTVGGVHVFSASLADRALLLSRRLVRRLRYAVVAPPGDVADFEFIDGEDLEKSQMRLRFAQAIDWANDEFLEIDLRAKGTKRARAPRARPARSQSSLRTSFATPAHLLAPGHQGRRSSSLRHRA